MSYLHAPEAEGILLAAGRCIATWSNVELNMAAMFTLLHAPHSQKERWAEYRALRASYDAIISFEVRLNMLDVSMMKSPVADGFLQEHWPSLNGRLAKKYKKRHGIAHFELRNTESGEILLQPFPTYSAYMDETVLPALSKADVEQRLATFEKLASETSTYAAYLALLWMPPEARERAERLKKQIRERGAPSS